jgi:succinate-semialdehyde dehydrogenase / glutarate-semialdehyde dehydrogenase
MMMLESINPATEEPLANFGPYDATQIDARLDAAIDAQRAWRKQDIARRRALLTQLAVRLRQDKERYARLVTLEMGKPIEEARAEIDKCALTSDFYAAHAESFLAAEPVVSSARDSRVVFDPLGLLLAVMPWNYPFWQAIRAAVPAICVGNVVVLKHASNVPQCALALEEAFKNAGAPVGLFTTLLVGSEAVDSLIADKRIAAVTFTGSTPVGRKIASCAGQWLKKQVLELGGSDPFIVLADADVQIAARTAVKARFSNAGQSCISSKRFIVEDAIADEFSQVLCNEAQKLVLGDPLQSETTLGPLARSNLRDDLHHQVAETLQAGAVLRLGGAIPKGRGFYYPATILDRVEPDMPAARQETFGPAATIIRARNAEHAVEIANDSEFGLGAALWTSNLERAAALARDIEAGAVFINALVASDPRLPFGGVKNSGFGRELGVWGLREFANIKTVWTG